MKEKHAEQPIEGEVLPAEPEAGAHLVPAPRAPKANPVLLEQLGAALQAVGLRPELPTLTLEAGAESVYADFFLGHYDNPHTRRAYERHVREFLRWCEGQELSLPDVRTHHVGMALHFPGTTRLWLGHTKPAS